MSCILKVLTNFVTFTIESNTWIQIDKTSSSIIFQSTVNCCAVLNSQRQLAVWLPGRFSKTESNISIVNETQI